ncbi:growth-regulated alpha protein-like [Takifugu rubripes]|uniref:growth-regulated alpha protein-like n=1 Tax=Takifugu rubripes TaxID=31033 RepID=UPI00114552D1|nr:growth-regulated alpha protein-like [Takifugu rubripes]
MMRTMVALCILLACIAVCTSSPACRCLNTVAAVNPSHVVDVVEYGPRPYCRRQEVIVILKNKRPRCLDPKGQFAQGLLWAKRRMEEHAARLKSSRSAKTTAARGSAAPPAQVL